MNVLIAHSESRKADHLVDLLYQFDKNINVLGKTTSLGETLELYNQKSSVLDVAFIAAYFNEVSTAELFKQFEHKVPMVFTSPSRHHAYEALKAQSIDFMLEPFHFNDVTIAVNKVIDRKETSKNQSNRYKERFLIKFGDKIQYKIVDDISFIYADGKTAYLMTRSTNRKYIIEYTLDELEKRLLNPAKFYRINRKFIVNIDVIEEARQYVNSRLKLILDPPSDFDMVVSREKVVDFKNWLNL